MWTQANYEAAAFPKGWQDMQIWKGHIADIKPGESITDQILDPNNTDIEDGTFAEKNKEMLNDIARAIKIKELIKETAARSDIRGSERFGPPIVVNAPKSNTSVANSITQAELSSQNEENTVKVLSIHGLVVYWVWH